MFCTNTILAAMATAQSRAARGGAQSAAGREDSMRVVLVGHSYIRRLNNFMRRTGQMDLLLDRVEVHCVFKGGALLWPPDTTQQMIHDVRRHRHDVIFLHMGENDLGRSPPHRILSDLLNFVNELAPLCSSHTVILGQLMHFHNSAHMDDAVDFINVRLSKDLPPGHIFWRHRSGLSHGGNRYLSDGAHLNDAGNQRYWRSIRTIVSRVCHRQC